MEVIDVDELNNSTASDQGAQSSDKNTTVFLPSKDNDYTYFLEKVSHEPKKNVEFTLSKDKLTVGRSPDSDINIISANVSRNHAVITKGANEWFIKDTRSTNGVYLKGTKLVPEKDFLLKIGDQFTLGPNNETEDIFTLKVRQRNQDQYIATSSLCMSPPCKIPKNDRHSENSEGVDLKKKLEVLEKQLRDKEENERLLHEKLIAKEKEKEENERRLQEKLIEKDKEKEESNRVMQEKLIEKDKEHKMQLNREREIILKQAAEVEKNFKERLQESNRENEQRLRQIVANQRQTILDEKTKVEQSLLQEMNDRDKDFQEKLQEEKRRLEKELAASETKAAMLETKLSETKNLKEQERGEILNKFSELIEAEMNCIICSELFVVAVTLGCSHTFCQECIATWKQKKKDCPICRNKIKTEARALVIDNFIDKMVENLPEEMKVHREKLVKEREQKAKENKAAVVVAQENVAANNIANYLGMLNARVNEPTVVINRLGIATGVPVNARARGFLDLTQQNNGAPQQPRNIQTTYQNQTVPTTRPTYIFSNATNANSHSIQIDANTIVRVVGNYRMPVNPPETRVQLERLLPATMGRFGTNQPQTQNTSSVPTLPLPHYHPPNRGRASVLNLAQQTRNIMPAPARPNEPIVITDSDDDAQTAVRGRASQPANNRARWSGRGQTHHQRN